MSKRITADSVKLKRAYEPSASDDGTRILIDRLWPCGVKKVERPLMNGSRTSRPAPRCGNGSASTRSASRSKSLARSWLEIKSRASCNAVPFHFGAGLRSHPFRPQGRPQRAELAA